jgi:hypothetical protein
VGHLGDLLTRLDEDQVWRGRQFERICKWFLTNDPHATRDVSTSSCVRSPGTLAASYVIRRAAADPSVPARNTAKPRPERELCTAEAASEHRVVLAHRRPGDPRGEIVSLSCCSRELVVLFVILETTPQLPKADEVLLLGPVPRVIPDALLGKAPLALLRATVLVLISPRG